MTTDERGWTALHYACENEAPVSVVSALLKADASSASRKTNDGSLPLHLACRFHAPLDVLKVLVETFPEGGKLDHGFRYCIWQHEARRPNRLSSFSLRPFRLVSKRLIPTVSSHCITQIQGVVIGR